MPTNTNETKWKYTQMLLFSQEQSRWIPRIFRGLGLSLRLV